MGAARRTAPTAVSPAGAASAANYSSSPLNKYAATSRLWMMRQIPSNKVTTDATG
jgi:hypothetical protein